MSFRGYGSCSSRVCQFARVGKLSRNSVIEPGLYSNSIIIAKKKRRKHRGEYRERERVCVRSLINQFHYQDYIVRFEMGVLPLPTRGGGERRGFDPLSFRGGAFIRPHAAACPCPTLISSRWSGRAKTVCLILLPVRAPLVSRRG